jgi:hypothetical protein
VCVLNSTGFKTELSGLPDSAIKGNKKIPEELDKP